MTCALSQSLQPWHTRRRLVMVILALAYLALRLPGLLEMPIFCDESIYLRWATQIRAHPWTDAFISLEDPKPPLHYWLLALVLPWFSNPLLAGRLLSVALGLATIPLSFALAGQWHRLIPEDQAFLEEKAFGTGWRWALIMLLCPYIAIHQRMALGESLLLSESLLVAFCTLAWINAPSHKSAAWVGLALGLAMLTKQNLSYALWSLPLSGMLLWPKGAIKSLLRTLPILVLVSLLVWLPYLLGPSPLDFKTRIFYIAKFHENRTGADRLLLVWQNFKLFFWPSHEGLLRGLPPAAPGAERPWQSGWYGVYLTLPLMVLALAGLIKGVFNRHWRSGLWLVIWFLSISAPLIIQGSMLYSRYALLSVPPMLLALSWMLPRQRALSHLLLAGLLCWPAWEIKKGIFDWQAPFQILIDRFQYVSGSPAGSFMKEIQDYLETQARQNEILVLSPSFMGHPGDTLWTFFADHPRIHLFEVFWPAGSPARPLPWPVLRRTEPNVVLGYLEVSKSKTPTYFVCPSPWATQEANNPNPTRSRDLIPRLFPQARLVSSAANPPDFADLPEERYRWRMDIWYLNPK